MSEKVTAQEVCKGLEELLNDKAELTVEKITKTLLPDGVSHEEKAKLLLMGAAAAIETAEDYGYSAKSSETLRALSVEILRFLKEPNY